MSDEWLTVEEIAQQLKLHPDTIREYIRKKQLPAFRFGTSYRIKRVDYDKFVQDRATNPEGQQDTDKGRG